MELAKGYKQVSYNELQSELRSTYEISGKSYVDLAYELEVKSISTAQNSFAFDTQVVSDQILTKVFDCLGFNAFVVWMKGERNYYIKNGKN